MAGSPLATMLSHFQKLVAASRTVDAADARLLELFTRDRSEEAFAALVWRHGPLVWRVCRRVLGCGDGAEDAFQATFLVLARKARSIKKTKSLPSWLHGVAFRVACQLRTQTERQARHDNRSQPAAASDPGHEAAMSEAGRIIEEEVHRLPERLRLPILLSYWEGKTNEETALALALPSGTVKTRLAKARSLLHERLRRRGVALPAGVIALTLAPQGANAAMPTALALKTTAGVTLAPRIVALAEQALPGVAATSWKPALLFAFACGVLAVGSGALMDFASAQKPAEPERATSSPVPANPAVAATDARTNKSATTDLHGDPLPTGASARLGTVQLRHAGRYPMPLAFSADGKTLLSASNSDRKLRLFDAASGKLTAVRSLEPVAERWWPEMALSGDGSTLVAQVANQGIFVWKTDSKDPPRRLDAEPQGSRALALSADGRLLAVAHHRFVAQPELHVWDLKTNRKRDFVIPDSASQVAFSPDAKRLASVAREAITVYDVGTGNELRRWPAETRGWSHQHVAFSPDNKQLAAYLADDKDNPRIELWDIETGKVRHTFPGQHMPVLFSPNGKLLATRGSDAIHIWDPANGKELRKGPRGYSFAFAPNSKSLAFRWGASLSVWNLQTDRVLTNQNGHASEVMALAFSRNGKWLASLADSVRLWEVATSKPVVELSPADGLSGSLGFSYDSKTLLCLPFRGPACRWELPSGRELPAYAAPELNAAKGWLRFSTDNSMILALDYKLGTAHYKRGAFPWLVKRWDTSGKELWRGDELVLFPEVASRDGKIRAAAALASLDPRGTAEERTRREPLIREFNFSADGRVLAVMLDRSEPGRVPDLVRFDPPGLDVWDVVSGTRVRRLPVSPSCRLALSPTGRYLAAAGLDALHVFDLATGEEILRRPAPEHFRSFGGDPFASSIAFSADGKTLATGLADGSILLWPVFSQSSPAPSKLTAADLDRLWSQLAEDASKGCVALWKLADAPESALPYLQHRLRPAAPLDAPRVQRLIAELGSDVFAERDQAFRELGRASRAILAQVAREPTAVGGETPRRGPLGGQSEPGSPTPDSRHRDPGAHRQRRGAGPPPGAVARRSVGARDLGG
jgi:RNA polymerase sigma factor (sigma-70 family)